MMATEGDVAIVTGAAQGIGKCITKCLLSEGYQVFLFDLSASRGKDTTKEFQQIYGETKASFTQCDVSNKDQFTESFNDVVKKCGHVTMMVNNAGIIDEHNFERCIAVNMTAVLHGSNIAIRHMRKDQGGKGGIIINTSSISALRLYHNLPTYVATKSGVYSFTRSWSSNPQIEDLGLTFMCLCPGFVDTEMTRNAAEDTLVKEHYEQATAAAFQFHKDVGMDQVEESFRKLLIDKINGSAIEVAPSGPKYIKGTVP